MSKYLLIYNSNLLYTINQLFQAIRNGSFFLILASLPSKNNIKIIYCGKNCTLVQYNYIFQN